MITKEQIEACMQADCDWPSMLRHREDTALFRSICALALRGLEMTWTTSPPADGEYVVLLPSVGTCLASFRAGDDVPWLSAHGEVFPVMWLAFPPAPEAV